MLRSRDGRPRPCLVSAPAPAGAATARHAWAILRRVADYARLIIYTDGASKGNPGPASIGAVIGIHDPDGDPIPV